MAEAAVIRIKPTHYIHVQDNNRNITTVEVGPQTFTRADHQRVVFGPEQMVMIPPRHYCTIANPVARNAEGVPVQDKNGNWKLRHGDEEVRLSQDPFPLYPGEKLVGKVAPLTVVLPNCAIKLKCVRDFEDGKIKRVAGEEWLFHGPGTYIPRVEAKVVNADVKSEIIRPDTALKLRARRDLVDSTGTKRITGEEWIVSTPGPYLPNVDEEVVDRLSAFILTPKKAVHLRASRTFTDAKGRVRKAGEEWLVTLADAETHIPDVYEQVVGEVKITLVTNRQFVVVLDPWKNGKPQLGQRELRQGEAAFFLQPGERLEGGIQDIYVLSEDEALLLRAREQFKDPEGGEQHHAGDRWMVKGPRDYIPPVEVEIVEKRSQIPLDVNEGIYVRDMRDGRVRAVTGQSYMLQPHEELWKKDLPKVVEDTLAADRSADAEFSERDKTRLVTYRAPHNSAVQVYDYKDKKARVVFGPQLVKLGPDEQFTVISLSGSQPKKPDMIKSIGLMLGPDFMTDIVIVETSDHARLSLKLSYNWFFNVDKNDNASAARLFQVPDFVGDACKAVASRVRGAVAGVSFDAFHRGSAAIIRQAVFGLDEKKEQIRDRLVFSANNLCITNIDIQSVEPVDQRTRDSLQKSVQLAIQITTESQEASARHESKRLEQEAVGRLERQKIEDEAEAEKVRKNLVQMQTEAAAIESTGQAKAEAVARAEAAKIQGEAAIIQAQLHAQATKIKSESELNQLTAAQEAEIEHQKALDELDITRAKLLADIEAAKFKDIVEAIGPDTLKEIAAAGPATQAKLLQGLGLKSFLITDGNSPVNLFNTAAGLVGAEQQQ